jgi:hypothetical protein
MGEVLGDEDGGVALGCFGYPDRLDRRQPDRLEVAQDGELPRADVTRQLLQRVLAIVDDEEADEVARRPDGQLLEVELVRSPLGERELPRQVEEPVAGFAKAKAREPRQERRVAREVGQSRFRRYAVTLAS